MSIKQTAPFEDMSYAAEDVSVGVYVGLIVEMKSYTQSGERKMSFSQEHETEIGRMREKRSEWPVKFRAWRRSFGCKLLRNKSKKQ